MAFLRNAMGRIVVYDMSHAPPMSEILPPGRPPIHEARSAAVPKSGLRRARARRRRMHRWSGKERRRRVSELTSCWFPCGDSGASGWIQASKPARFRARRQKARGCLIAARATCLRQANCQNMQQIVRRHSPGRPNAEGWPGRRHRSRPARTLQGHGQRCGSLRGWSGFPACTNR